MTSRARSACAISLGSRSKHSLRSIRDCRSRGSTHVSLKAPEESISRGDLAMSESAYAVENIELIELESTEELAARFNSDRGSPRLVLLLSPT